MNTDRKKAYILMDQNDLEDFKDRHGITVDDKSLFLPIDFTAMMQVIFTQPEEAYYAPKVINENEEFFAAREIYEDSQKFLKQLLLTNGLVDKDEEAFPQEYIWACIWISVNRALSFCSDFLDQYAVEEVVIIKRNKYVTQGGLLINIASFSHLIEKFFESKNVKVSTIEHQGHYDKPRTIFFEQSQRLKTSVRYLIQFVRWKLLSLNNKNDNCIFINPSYDNVINCYKAYRSPGRKTAPQVFYGNRMPFLHSWRKSVCFLIAKSLFKQHDYNNYEVSINPYKINLHDVEFDFANLFRETVSQYLTDAKWMKGYIDLFWQKCMKKGKRYLTIFSLPPVYLHSYFLIKKTKDNGGKVAVWQHGGVYGYTDFFQHYITDYKNADYFLSFGKDCTKDVTKFEKNCHVECANVGSNVMYAQQASGSLKTEEPPSQEGLFLPGIVGLFYIKNCVKWQADLQFKAIKQIIDFCGSGVGGKVVTKGLRSHSPHYVVQRYIESKKTKYLSFTDVSTDTALSNNPKFIILDNQSTSLLQVLSQYTGPIFLMLNQESALLRQDALDLIKRRVVYSESVDELKMQLTDFFKDGSLNGTDTHDRSFIDTYIKRFCYSDYERFLQKATGTCQH
ncbi:MAG TPA: hypothetical protein ENH94_05990 [Phycisphaerales bacterium]|nr:hypothetical protein [Phycisphaerales bacterium]